MLVKFLAHILKAINCKNKTRELAANVTTEHNSF